MVKKYKILLWLFFPCILFIAVSALSQALHSGVVEPKNPDLKKVDNSEPNQAGKATMILTSN